MEQKESWNVMWASCSLLSSSNASLSLTFSWISLYVLCSWAGSMHVELLSREAFTPHSFWGLCTLWYTCLDSVWILCLHSLVKDTTSIKLHYYCAAASAAEGLNGMKPTFTFFVSCDPHFFLLLLLLFLPCQSTHCNGYLPVLPPLNITVGQ